MNNKPNILILMTDEQRYDVVGYVGNDVVRTPNLDRLAKDAVIFNNAYTPSPICIPARQSMMAGQMPKTCNCRRWAEDLEPNYMTFSRQLTRYGYETVACGKLHHMGTDQMQGWQRRVAGDVNISKKFIETVDNQSHYVEPQKGTGKRTDAEELIKANIGAGRVHRVDRKVLAGTIDYIEDRFVDSHFDRPNANQPLMLMVSMVRPHYPYQTSESKMNYYINRVNIYSEDKPFDHPFLSQRRVTPGVDVSEREITRATAAYYGMIEEVDEDFGKILDTLENAGQNLDDWMIVFTSDHGEMLGEHGIWEKQKFFEGSARVPLFIRYPKRFKPQKVDKNVNLIDLFATFCDLTDIPIPEGLNSRSLVGIMDDPESQLWDNESISQFSTSIEHGQHNVMIKRDSLKYQYYGEYLPEVLFDLDQDATERTNFIEKDEYKEDVKYFRNRVKTLI